MTTHETFKLLDKKDCHKILEKYTTDVLRIIDIQIKPADNQVIGYLGDHFRLEITYVKSNDLLKKASFFVKSQPVVNENLSDYVNELGVFKKESSLYEYILPKLAAIAGSYFSPECYLIKENCLVLEDLKLNNFRMIGTYLNLEEAESLVKCLATFHCSSLIYEEMNSIDKKYRLIEEYDAHFFKEVAFSFVDGQPRYNWMKNVVKCTVDVIKLLNFKNSDRIVEKLRDVVFNRMESYVRPSKEFRNVLTHSDLWWNNFMINDKLECVLVDFQLARYTPPAYDLLLSLFLNTTKKFLDTNLDYLLELYYETFSNLLLKYDLKPELVYSEKEFRDSIKYYRIPSYIEALFTSTNTLISSETSNYIMSDSGRFQEFTLDNRSKYILDEIERNESLKNGILELLVPLVDLLMT